MGKLTLVYIFVLLSSVSSIEDDQYDEAYYERWLWRSVRSGDLENIKLLTDGIVDINMQTELCVTPIYSASEYGVTDAVTLLIERGADVNVPNCVCSAYSNAQDCEEHGDVLPWMSGITPLMIASFGGPMDATGDQYLATVEALTCAGANMKATSDTGMTALHWAAQMGQREIALLLLQKGADPTQQENEGKTPADLARASDLHELAISIDSFTAPISSDTTCAIGQPIRVSSILYDIFLLGWGGVLIIVDTLLSNTLN
ncbi:unnamed protein product, partial [Meganyctiphanes norvegica]